MIRALQIKNNTYFTDRTDAINRYYSEIAKIPLLTMDEEVELFHRYNNGDKSVKEKIILANQRFVVSVARKYASKEFELLDLISEGNIGLNRAIEKFDVTKGFKFISYAVWHIRACIIIYINKAQLINRRKDWDLYKKVEEIRKKINKEFRDPSNYEILSILKSEYDMDVSLEELQGINFDSIDEVSEDDLPLIEHKFNSAYHACNDVEKTIMDEYNKDLSKKLMVVLNDRERGVVEMLYGINSEQTFTISEIAKRFNCCEQNIGAIHKKALFKMRRFHKLHQNKN